MFTLGENDILQYVFKDYKTVYKGKYSICSNPLCTCFNIDFYFFYQNDQLLVPELCVVLNVNHKDIAKERKEIQDEYLARKIVDDLTYHDWQFLTKLYLETKTAYTEQSDLMSLDVKFPMDDIEKEGSLISFNGVLPFAKIIIFNVNGLPLIVEDLYCVRQDCNCNDVNLFISPFHEDEMPLPFVTEKAECIYIIYNLKKKKWNVEEQSGLNLNPKNVMSALSEVLDIYGFYRRRHRLMRNLYKKYRQKYFKSISVVEKAAIGRNDPCPCGSGKKYKKCCMGK